MELQIDQSTDATQASLVEVKTANLNTRQVISNTFKRVNFTLKTKVNTYSCQ